VRRILWATSVVILLQLCYLGATNLTATIPAVAPLLYVIPLAAAAAAAYVLFNRPGRHRMFAPPTALSRV
jgi:hypothetical protein